jgi:hypothetical protein
VCEEITVKGGGALRGPGGGYDGAGPMQEVVLDYFHYKGQEYLLMVDRASGYHMSTMVRTTTTEATINQLLRWLHDFGFPRKIRSDRVPSSETALTNTAEGLGGPALTTPRVMASWRREDGVLLLA